MRLLRDRRFLLALMVGLGLAVVAGWAARERVSRWWWTRISGSPLDPAELAALDACAEPGWDAWLKVLATDRELGCSEGFVVRALAVHADHGVRAAWLATESSGAGAAPDTRMRAAVALSLTGEVPPVEAWALRGALPEGRREAWTVAARDPELAAVLGPAAAALATVAAAVEGEVPRGEALGPLEWLASVGVPEADAAVDRALTALTGVDAALARSVGERVERGLPVTAPPFPGRGRLRRACVGACVAERLGLLRAALETSDQDTAPSEPSTASPPELPPELDALLLASGRGRAGFAWSLEALRRWIAGAPEARLAALAATDGGADLARFGWDGSAPPFAAAALLSALGEVSIRPVSAELVLVEVGGRWVARGCAPGASAPAEVPAEDWPVAAVRARALLELAGPEVAPALAGLWDPTVRTDVVGGDRVAVRIGAALSPMVPLAGADQARARLGGATRFCSRHAVAHLR